MNWRAIMKSESHEQNEQNTQNPPQKKVFAHIADIAHANEKQKRALGYGCAGCGNRLYHAIDIWVVIEMAKSSSWSHEHIIEQHWQCEQCGAVFQWICGTAGPKILN